MTRSIEREAQIKQLNGQRRIKENNITDTEGPNVLKYILIGQWNLQKLQNLK